MYMVHYVWCLMTCVLYIVHCVVFCVEHVVWCMSIIVVYTLQTYRCHRQLVDDCSPGRGGMAQDGETRGGTVHGEMGRCRESKG